MKSLRRSLHNRDSATTPPISPPVAFPALHRPSSAVQPPKKVIRALQSYRPNAPQELGFSKGDFFHVVSEMDGWFEAHNPVSGARGLVPKDCFEEFPKANAAFVIEILDNVIYPYCLIGLEYLLLPFRTPDLHQLQQGVLLLDIKPSTLLSSMILLLNAQMS